ncbi:MAG: hypothetical protein SGARI_001642, partial [Bacillariaceae sp.]
MKILVASFALLVVSLAPGTAFQLPTSPSSTTMTKHSASFFETDPLSSSEQGNNAGKTPAYKPMKRPVKVYNPGSAVAGSPVAPGANPAPGSGPAQAGGSTQSSARSYFSIASEFDRVETSTYMNDPEFQRRLYDYTDYWDLFDHKEAEWSSSEFIRKEHHRRKKEKRKLRQSGGAPTDSSGSETLYVGGRPRKRLVRFGEQAQPVPPPPAAVAPPPPVAQTQAPSVAAQQHLTQPETDPREAAFFEEKAPLAEAAAASAPEPQQQPQNQDSSLSSWFALAAEFDRLEASTYLNDPEFQQRLADVTQYWDLFDDPNAEWSSSEFIRKEHHRRKKEKRKIRQSGGVPVETPSSETLYVGNVAPKKLQRYGDGKAETPPAAQQPVEGQQQQPQSQPPSSTSSYFVIASEFDRLETSTYMNDPEFRQRLADSTQYWDLFDHPEAEWSSSEFIRKEHHRRKKEKRKIRQSGGAPVDKSESESLYVGNVQQKKLVRFGEQPPQPVTPPAAPAAPSLVASSPVASSPVASSPAVETPRMPAQPQQQQVQQSQAPAPQAQASAKSYFSIASEFDRVETSTYMNDP